MLNKPTHNHQSHSSYTRNLALMLCLGMLAGVLIWAKLRLVTDIPRSAYADPRETQAVSPVEDSGADYFLLEETTDHQDEELFKESSEDLGLQELIESSSDIPD